MFKDICEKITSNVANIISVGIWGSDGLELENCIIQPNQINFELFGAEVADIINKVNSTKEPNNNSLLRINYADKTLIISPVNKEFFYMIFAQNNVIISKLEFYLELCKEDIIARVS